MRIGRFLAAQGASDYTIMILFSVFMGSLAGLAAVGFHESVGLISDLLYPRKSHLFPGWIIILVPAIGMLLQWAMTSAAPREAGERGIIAIIKSVSLKNGDISFKTTLFHFLAPIICIGTGGTVGPEAPVAQTGAGIVSSAGTLLGLSQNRLRIFVAAGAGAAIAGVFNTPLAGVFFCIEVILFNEIQASTISVFLLTSVSASAVSRLFLGNEPRFHFGILNSGPVSHLGFYLLLGLGAGILSLLFIRASELSGERFARLYKRIPRLVGMVGIGLLMGVAIYFFPDVRGVGYDTINSLLIGKTAFDMALVLFLLKFILVILILSSGGFGGVFAPSLFLGACFGSLFAAGITAVTHVPVDVTTFTLVGMGAMLAGVNSVPITAILMLFEMTNDYNFILPLMLGVVGSHAVSHLLLNGSIYQRKLHHSGYDKSPDLESSVLRATTVRQVARQDIFTIPETTPVAELVRESLQQTHDSIYTLNRRGEIVGVITSSALRHLINDFHALRDVIIAQDIADPNITHVSSDATLEEALRIFARRRVEELPVIESQTRKIFGTLHYQDLMNGINEGMVRRSIRSSLAADFKMLQRDEILEALPGFSIAEAPLPEKFIGKNIGQLHLRNKYKIDVLMIERQSTAFDDAPQRMFPEKDIIFQRGDKLIVYGRTLDVVNFKKTFDH